MKLSQIAEAARSIEEGEWVNEVDGLPGVRLKTIGFNAVKARNYTQRFLRKKGWHKKTRLSPEDLDVLYANLVADVTAQDWAGIDDNSGPIVFDRAALAGLLFKDGDRDQINPSMRPLLSAWRDAGNSVGALEEDYEDAEKNFATSSSGEPSGVVKKNGSRSS